MTSWAYFDGDWVDIRQPLLPLQTQGLHYGTAVFEGIRAYRPLEGGRPVSFMAVEHFERFLNSCATLRIELSESCQDLVGVCDEIIVRNGLDDDCYIRPVAFKRSLQPGVPFGVRLRGVSHGVFMTAVPMPSRLGRTTRLGISSVRRVPDASIPTQAKITGSYVASALAVDECVAAGHDDALLLTVDGRVAEASTSNIVVRVDGRVVTPSLDQGILPGITRRVVLDLAQSAGFETVERPIEVAELFAADEILLVGTGVEISPVVSVAGVAVRSGSPGPLAIDMCAGFEKLVRGTGIRY